MTCAHYFWRLVDRLGVDADAWELWFRNLLGEDL